MQARKKVQNVVALETGFGHVGGVMNAIEVSITRTTKPYVGRITGKSEQYGFELEFCRAIKRHSAKYATVIVTEPGIYRTNDDVTIGSRGITSGFFRVSPAGEVTEISKEEAFQAASANA